MKRPLVLYPTTDELKTDLLLKLADMLEADAANEKGMRFDLNRVAYFEYGTTPGLDCGTTGCAMGLAAISGAFEGLGYSQNEFSDFRCTINGVGMNYHFAAMDAFGLDYLTAGLLFSPHSYEPEERTGARGERAVAQRIRNYVSFTEPVVAGS